MTEPVSPWNAPSLASPPAATGSPAEVFPRPAGFWIRLLASLMDGFLLGIAQVFFLTAVGAVGGLILHARGAGASTDGLVFGAVAVAWLGTVVGSWLYSALLESSARQATLGKLALGLVVADSSGARIGFGRATGRFFAKILSAIPLNLGFVLAGFTDRKRALHDMLAGTLVERRKGGSTGVAVAVVAVIGLFGVIFVTGVLAAIAIPNFVKYQLRAKASEAPMLLRSLAAAQERRREAGQGYAELELPAQAPGSAKLIWTAEERAAAAELDWPVEGATYFTYRVAVGESDDGRQGYSACAEADLDGDGQVAAWIMFQPVLEPSGEVFADPPDPPCAHDPELYRALSFQPGDPVGQPVRLSPENVF